MSEDQTGVQEDIPNKVLSLLNSMLVSGEKIQAVAIQRRIFSLLRRRSLVSATSGRLIGMTRGIIGGFTPVDLRWQDIKTADIKVGIFGCTLTITGLNQPDLASGGAVRGFQFSGLRKDDAQAVYRISQGQEQSWREKRRQRDIEEMRAKSGGFQGTISDQSSQSNEDPIERLKKAKALLDQGLISDSEYEAIKARVINQF